MNEDRTIEIIFFDLKNGYIYFSLHLNYLMDDSTRRKLIHFNLLIFEGFCQNC
jgi:hypothetical protein